MLVVELYIRQWWQQNYIQNDSGSRTVENNGGSRTVENNGGGSRTLQDDGTTEP